MAIRFSCPSCHQPIEVDDDWAGQTVACPYCRKVVSAPKQSDWPPAQVPLASPARGPFAPPPAPGVPPVSPTWSGEHPPAQPSTGGMSSAGWALMLAIGSAVLFFVGYIIWVSAVLNVIQETTGKDPSPQEIRQAIEELLASQSAPVSSGAAVALLVGGVLGIASIALAIRSLVRNEGRYVKAIVSCLLAALFLVCQGIMMLVIFMQRAGPAA